MTTSSSKTLMNSAAAKAKPTPTQKPGAKNPLHMACLRKLVKTLTTSDGFPIEVWKLRVPKNAHCLSNWAAAFREQYCSDSEIDKLRAGTGLSRAQYLTQLVFPDKLVAPGPGIRSGDFAELLVSDYVEYILGYWVPRGKYADKASRDESTKGVDILGFRVANQSTPAPVDTLLAFEVKAQLTGRHYKGRLQEAVDDSSKDYIRRAITLNATKRRLLRAGQTQHALLVQRFQNLADCPYIYRSGAAAVLSDAAYDRAAVKSSTKATGHQNAGNLQLIVIGGKDLMSLVHALYRRAADEA